MEPIRRLYLDTNVFVELGEGQDERRQLLFEIVAAQMKVESLLLCTSELTLAELLVLPYRERNDALIQLYDNWIMQGNTWLEVGPVTREVLWHAALVRRDYPKVKLPDAIHISTAIGLECSHFLTADNGIPRDIKITNERSGWSRMSPSLRVVAPSMEILQAMSWQRK